MKYLSEILFCTRLMGFLTVLVGGIAYLNGQTEAMISVGLAMVALVASLMIEEDEE